MPAMDVLVPSHDLKVIRLNAGSLLTEVVDLEPIRDRTAVTLAEEAVWVDGRSAALGTLQPVPIREYDELPDPAGDPNHDDQPLIRVVTHEEVLGALTEDEAETLAENSAIDEGELSSVEPGYLAEVYARPMPR